MIKKILLVIGVVAFSVFWWMGFKKVLEMPKTETACKDLGFQGGKK